MGIRDLPAHQYNPFIKGIVYKRGVKRTVVKKGKAIIDTETGELEDLAEIVQIQEVDATKFVKLYTADLKKFFSLTPTAQKLLHIVLDQVQDAPQSDMVTLNLPLALDYFDRVYGSKIVKQTFYTAVVEMHKKGFLARSAFHSEQYYINPAIFFNGDRIRLVKEYRIKRQTLLPLDKEYDPTITGGER